MTEMSRAQRISREGWSAVYPDRKTVDPPRPSWWQRLLAWWREV